MPPTTIQLQPEVKESLDELKKHPRESYNEVIKRLVETRIDEDPLSEEAIEGIEEALEDIRKGRLHTEEEIRKEFGVE
jgi:predicted transcriptional regulator